MADGYDVLQGRENRFWQGLEDLRGEAALVHGDHHFEPMGGSSEAAKQPLKHDGARREACPELLPQPPAGTITSRIGVEVRYRRIIGAVAGCEMALDPSQDTVVGRGFGQTSDDERH